MGIPDNKVVMFVDLLGFASLTEAYAVEPDVIKEYERPFSWDIEMVLPERRNLLTEAFTSFHFSLKTTIDQAKMRYPLTAITFSDSRFRQ